METSASDVGVSTPLRGGRRRVVVVGLATALLSAIMVGVVAFLMAFEADCRPLRREELSLAEMGQLRSAVDLYKATPEGLLSLTPRQASFLLREEFELPIWVGAEGDQTSFEARLPQWGRCWNLSFRGRVAAAHRVATLAPQDFEVGQLSMTWLVRGRSWQVLPGQLGYPKAAELLQHLESMDVTDGHVRVELDDPRWLR